MTTSEEWQGRIGQEWADKADVLDTLLGPVGKAGIAALDPTEGSKVLDLGCGAGGTSQMLADQNCDVTGVDISEDLLAVAQIRDRRGRCRFIKADAACSDLLGPYAHLFSRCGSMFFDDPVGAWTHLRHQVGPACGMALVCWDHAKHNEWARLPMEAARPILGPILGEASTQSSPGTVPGPFAWAEPEIFSRILGASGWHELRWHSFEAKAEIGTGDNPDPVERAVLFSLRIGPLARQLRGVDELLRNKVADNLRRIFSTRLEAGSVRVATRAWIIQGQSQ